MSPQSVFHADEADRVDSERHAGLVIRAGKILLIHRIKAGREYWVLPGGHRREKETGEQGLIREIFEESGIQVRNPKLAYHHTNELGHQEFYYTCTWVSGTKPKLLGEEKVRNSDRDFYAPLWIDLKEVMHLNILPGHLKSWLVLFQTH